MTALIGLRCDEGIILASDCLMTHPEGNYQGRKLENINFGMYKGYREDGGFSGLVVGMTGQYGDMFGKPTLTFQFNNSVDRLAYLLLSDDLKQRTSEELFQASREAESYEDEKRLAACGSLKRLVDQTAEGRIPFDLTVMGFSTDREPILVYLGDGNVTQVNDYVASGTGKKLTEPVLAKGYSSGMSLDDAIALTCNAMNAALEVPEEFKGYEIAIVDGRGEEPTVSTQWNSSAERIDPSSLDLKPIFPNEKQRKRATR